MRVSCGRTIAAQLLRECLLLNTTVFCAVMNGKGRNAAPILQSDAGGAENLEQERIAAMQELRERAETLKGAIEPGRDGYELRCTLEGLIVSTLSASEWQGPTRLVCCRPRIVL